MRRKHEGYFLLVAIVLIMVMGAMGMVTSYLVANRAKMSVALQGGMSAFYVAEAGLEVASRLLVGTNLVSGQAVSCGTLTGNSLLTNSAILNGTFTATAPNGALYTGSSTLSGGITATSNTLTLASVTGFAPHGRVRIDNEAIDYASISGNSLVGLNRGAAGTTANSHLANAAVSQSVCLIEVTAGVPSLAAPKYQRQLQMAVEIITSSDIWAVGVRSGNSFQIMRYGSPIASSWNDYSITDVSNRSDLNAVSASSTTNAWAVGDVRGSNLTFVHWNGSNWTAAPVANACTGQNLEGVATVGTSEAWAVGARYRPACANSGNFRYTLMKWNGTAWSLLTPTSSPAIPADAAARQNLNAISMYDSNNDGIAELGFAVGNSGTILQYNGVNWVTNISPNSNNILGVSVVSSSEAWAVTNTGAIFRWNGSSWSNVASPTTNSLNAINMVDSDGDGAANFGWAVGSSGRIIYYNGTSWSTQVSPVTTILNGVIAVSNTSAWAVGNTTTLLQWDGSNWSTATSTISGNINGIGIFRGLATSSGSKVGSWQQIFN